MAYACFMTVSGQIPIAGHICADGTAICKNPDHANLTAPGASPHVRYRTGLERAHMRSNSARYMGAMVALSACWSRSTGACCGGMA
jgi:hypothetical protein